MNMPDPAAALQQAQAHQRAGNLPEAERLYRETVSRNPGLAEAHVGLGVVLLQTNRSADAETHFRRAIALKPGYARAHAQLGGALAAQNRREDAVASYRHAIALKPDYAEAHHNLAISLLHLEQLDDALAEFRQAATLQPGAVRNHIFIGTILARKKQQAQALAAFRQALEVQPDNPEGLANAGAALIALDQPEEAAAMFRRMIAAHPTSTLAPHNLGLALAAARKWDDAIEAYRRAIRLKGDYGEAYSNLANALRKSGRLTEAEEAGRRAIALQPGQPDAYQGLGGALLQQGKLEESFRVFLRAAELRYRPSSSQGDPSHKAEHDREQAAYFAANGVPPGQFQVRDGNRLAGPAVNPSNAIGAIQEQWRTVRPQIAVIDDLLTSEALQSLRRFCWGSTIWQRSYGDGYLGAMPEHGFAVPLLAQIAEELAATYPQIIGGHPLLHLWAFKYDSRLSGIKLHADFAAVNVNFWITPDEANLDAESGGLIIWDRPAPLDWGPDQYNGDVAASRAFLQRSGAKSTVVHYRSNRAVIFDSDLFHETDKIAFRDGYENRRINATFLFGQRHAPGADQPQTSPVR